MENSIEEDIKIIENFINWLTIDFEYDSGNEIKAIEHILSDYKKVLKENEYMHNELDKQQTTINKYAKENEVLRSNPCKKSVKSDMGKPSEKKVALTRDIQKTFLQYAENQSYENQYRLYYKPDCEQANW